MFKNIAKIGIDCCGCGNCFYICKKGAITLKADDEGFIQPFVNYNCVDCGACLNVCPQTKEVQTIDNQQAYIVLTKDANIKKISASGGVFGTVAKSLVNERNAYVCAASFVEGTVKHIITQDYSDIKKCQGSKYVQSSLEDCLPRIKGILKDKQKTVLFCGTPCQVAAVYSFLGERPSNLYTLDLICHGVPSPLFFLKDLKHYCKHPERLSDVRFRWRNPMSNEGKSSFILSIEKQNMSRLYSSSYDPYFATFMKGESFRLSCYQCHYANLNRVGDITIGDCDSAKLYPNFHPNESKSSIIVNNSNGTYLWSMVKKNFFYTYLDLQYEAEINHQLSIPFKKPSSRSQIYSDAKKMSYWKFKSKYAAPTTIRQKVLAIVQTYIPFAYKWIIQRTLK